MELAATSREAHEFSRRLVIAGIGVIVVAYFGWLLADNIVHSMHAAHELVKHAAAGHAVAHATEVHHPAPPDFYSVIPFAALLLCVALLPLARRTEHWWEHNSNRLLVSASLGCVTLLYYAFLYGHGVVDHATHGLTAPGLPAALAVLKNALLVEYVPFIVLLFSLYVISGGVAIEGTLVGRPKLNSTIIGLGALLASLIGTTGAAMLLIRPILRANAERKYVAHTVVFFIFVVCNTGGCLLPIGDPPLFLGFLRGVDFLWTLNLWPMWLMMNGALLAVYFLWDTVRYRQENPETRENPVHDRQPLRIRGAVNFLWLLGVIVCVALLDPSKTFPGTSWHAPLYFREIMMLALAGLSLWSTSAAIRQMNSFNYGAIIEVAALFIGIFICMQAPVQILNTYGAQLGIDQPWEFYWGTGVLSSFLDNAPTYVVFFETARTMPAEGATEAGIAVPSLIAISLGAVFMGAMTYIGNGPNFMVKAIAEKNNVRMPTFFGYMAYSCAILLPLSLILTLIFF